MGSYKRTRRADSDDEDYLAKLAAEECVASAFQRSQLGPALSAHPDVAHQIQIKALRTGAPVRPSQVHDVSRACFPWRLAALRCF